VESDKIKMSGLNIKRSNNRIYYLQKRYEGLYNKNLYNKNQYKRFVDVVSTNYMMTSWQRLQAKDIIEKSDLKDLYPNLGWEGIVTAICFYIMRKDNPKRPLPYNKRFVRSLSLTKDVYDLISKKLKAEEESRGEANTYYIVDEE
jgi:hypothetical protein